MSIRFFLGGLKSVELKCQHLKTLPSIPFTYFSRYMNCKEYMNIVCDLKWTAFYRRPLEKGSIKFVELSIGVNKLSYIMKTMFAGAGIEGYSTNSSDGLKSVELKCQNLKTLPSIPFTYFSRYMNCKEYMNIVCDLKWTAFYRRPLEKGSIKFVELSIGVNKLSYIMKTMFAGAGIEGYSTNSSG
ncbi:unnamed protein product [Mytilus edulis]|uniref:Uncharacterized protein n=1 Tax=Mytilus edulis TaxID=6550 RepID=A0A8S3QPB5_MYTED|nr:unnamed protein product [Mytilus edulis]